MFALSRPELDLHLLTFLKMDQWIREEGARARRQARASGGHWPNAKTQQAVEGNAPMRKLMEGSSRYLLLILSTDVRFVRLLFMSRLGWKCQLNLPTFHHSI